MEKYRVIISTHAVFLNGKDIYGPPHATSLFLNKKKTPHLFIKHDLYGNLPSRIEFHSKGKLQKVVEAKIASKTTAIRYLKEILINMDYAKKIGYCNLFIGVDPLNAFAGRLLKLTKIVDKTVYFSADFALKRFQNVVMNRLYHILDQLAMGSSDQTWSVSKRIVDYRKKKGLPNIKNKLMPNAPFFDDIPRKKITEIDMHTLVIVSAIQKGINFRLLVDVVADLKKTFKDLKLQIVGSGPDEKSLKDYVKKKELNSTVKFLGAKSHTDMFKVLTKSGIGIAFYEDAENTHFRYFSDPMKVRDYLASGLPAYVTGNSSIGEEIENTHSGAWLKLDHADIVTKLKKVLKSNSLYSRMRSNAIELAKNYDIYRLLEAYIKQLKISL